MLQQARTITLGAACGLPGDTVGLLAGQGAHAPECRVEMRRWQGGCRPAMLPREVRLMPRIPAAVNRRLRKKGLPEDLGAHIREYAKRPLDSIVLSPDTQWYLIGAPMNLALIYMATIEARVAKLEGKAAKTRARRRR